MEWWTDKSFTKCVHDSDEALILQCVKNYFGLWKEEWENRDSGGCRENDYDDESKSASTKRKGGARKGRKTTASKTQPDFKEYLKLVKQVRRSDFVGGWDEKLKKEAKSQMDMVNSVNSAGGNGGDEHESTHDDDEEDDESIAEDVELFRSEMEAFYEEI
jgi:hypothetical protein